jgi:hypothetical protein
MVTAAVRATAQFCQEILVTDEACYTRKGVLNFHRMHLRSEENPYRTVTDHFQHRFPSDVRAGIVGDCIIGP